MTALKAAFTTLGCKVNQDETAGMIMLFEKAGFEIVDFHERADVYVVNTCTVTHLGSRKSRQLLRQARRRNPDSLVVAAGCYPQVAAAELSALPEVDLIVGNSHKTELVNLVKKALSGLGSRIVVAEPAEFQDLPVAVLNSRNRATLKIQEGCQRFCTYCIVPKARGGLRSMPLETIVEKAKELVEAGFREIVLTGINLTSYGKERGSRISLARVINTLAPKVKPARIRISSVEPTDFTSELIGAFAANPNVCKDFHIPLQSGSDSVLQRMGRKYGAGEYLDLVAALKKRFDRPSFSTDIIVGFPGETEAEFRQTEALVREVGFCRLHVFRFSPRPGTAAAAFKNQVSPATASSRSGELIKLGEELAEKFASQLLDCEEELLVEELSPLIKGNFVGYGERYMRIHCPAVAPPGSLVKVRICGHKASELLARQV